MARPDAGSGGEPQTRSYAAGARILSIGIASTGLVTFLYFVLASQALGPDAYSRIAVMWSVLLTIVSVIYRPIEQLLSRSIADRRARGLAGEQLRVPLAIQAGFALAFLAVALPLRTTITDDVLGGSATLYWILVVAVLAYAASYFARGWLAGHQRFGLYGGLVFLESLSRTLFALAAVIGITSGQDAVAAGMAAAPFVSLVVVPFAFSRRRAKHVEGEELVPAADAALEAGPASETVEEASGDLSLRRGTGFALAVFAIMLSEQTLLNGGVLAIDATSGNAALAGFVFNVLLIARAPLVLFQAIQTSLLPHLAGLEARDRTAEFAHAIRVTLLAIAAFAGAVALGLLLIGPEVMSALFKGHADYSRVGLAIVGVGMGLHLASGTLNQSALARGDARLAAGAWLLCAGLFIAWCLSGIVPDEVERVEVGYFGAALLLCCLLYGLYRRPSAEAVATAEPAPA